VRSSLHRSILLICVTAWVVCSILFAFAAYLIPRDIETLREAMRERAEIERGAQGAGGQEAGT
jgi:hypothetical protein